MASKQKILLPVYIILFLFFSSSCEPSSDYPGFNNTWSGIHYRLNVIGESDVSPRPGDFITVDLDYSTVYDSVFFSARRKFKLNESSYRGSVEECFSMMHIGDNADFILNVNDFFKKTLGTVPPAFLEESDQFVISVDMIDIQTEQSYLQEKEAFLSWIEDFSEYEKVRLQQFIREEQMNVRPDSSGLYYLTLNEGFGKQVEKGDTIDLHYEGKFMYGKFFDSTVKREEKFEFVYGQEWQVVEGLEMAIGKMREGEKALVIVPSELGFGKEGSSTGIIPPYTSLVFEVELLNIR